MAHLKSHLLKWLRKSEAREENKPLNRVLSRFNQNDLHRDSHDRHTDYKNKHFEVDKYHEIILPMQSSLYSSGIR